MKRISRNMILGMMLIFAAPTLLIAQNEQQAQHKQHEKNASEVIKDWPETAKKAANAIIEKYGEPGEFTSSMLIWENTGPFKKTIVYKEEVDHDFPMPHKDVLEQFVNYDVPVDKFDELAAYDGSVIVERTKGEMSARCDKEAANFLALNLAHDIINEDLNVEEARQQYADAIMQMLEGEKPEYLQSLQFEVPSEDVADAGETIMDMSKVKELMPAK